MRITKASPHSRFEIVNLLKSADLPYEDLPECLDNFFIAVDNDRIIGVVGLEPCKKFGLLRSLVVDQLHRNKKIAGTLVELLEGHAVANGIHTIFLLTETADKYFSKLGYTVTVRDFVPDEIQSTGQFQNVCPATAVVMKKDLF